MSDFVIGITGASGSIYGIRLIQELCRAGHNVNIVVTSAGKKVMKEEIGTSAIEQITLSETGAQIKIWENDDFDAPFISGSSAADAMVMIPCSMGKLAAIANGISGNMLERVADVTLKEGKKLILVIRETPLSMVHIENMAKAARAGAVILPAMPAFYHHPKTVDDLINFIVGKVLNILGIEHNLFKAWRKQ
ncbi:MAG: UbiX family flavin prenyltransferase [Nitrospirota bacterium]